MRRETANVLLLLLGGCLLKLVWTGDYLRYVKPQHRWWLIGAGLIVVMLAGVAIWRDMRGASVGTDGGHSHGTARSAWLLLVPALAGLIVAPPALGADSVARSLDTGTRQVDPAEIEAYPPLPAGEVTPMPISQFHARATWDKGRTLVGRQVRLTGFVVRQGERTYVARVVIGCCAADGYPVPVRLVGDAPMLRTLRDDEWIQVVGRYRPPRDATRARAPEIAVDLLRRVPEPEDPYEY